MNTLISDKLQRDILISQMAEAFDYVTQKENMSVYDYNNELFENGLSFLYECQAEEFRDKDVFWSWWKYRYRLHDLEYMCMAPSMREPYRIWKLSMITNENIKRDFVIHVNRNHYERAAQ